MSVDPTDDYVVQGDADNQVVGERHMDKAVLERIRDEVGFNTFVRVSHGEETYDVMFLEDGSVVGIPINSEGTYGQGID